MTSFYTHVNGGQLYDRNSVPSGIEQVKTGDPLTIEYKIINISSSDFDRFGKSEIVISNAIKNVASKDRTLQSVVYYDQNASVIKKHKGSSKGIYKITSFNAKNFGFPVACYLPGYQNTDLTITISAQEIDDFSMITNVLNIAKSITGLVSTTAVPYITLANDVLGVCSLLIDNIDTNKSLCEDFTIQFFNTNIPIYVGSYVCIPGLTDINVKKQIIKNYIVEDNGLYKIIDGVYQEYDETYYILQVSNNPRTDLVDYDYLSSAADIISQITPKAGNTSICTQLLNTAKDAYDLGLIQTLSSTYDQFLNTNRDDVRLQVVALYRQLSSSSQERFNWFNTSFPDIGKMINSLL